MVRRIVHRQKGVTLAGHTNGNAVGETYSQWAHTHAHVSLVCLVVDLATTLPPGAPCPDPSMLCSIINTDLTTASPPPPPLNAVKWTVKGNLLLYGGPHKTLASLQATAPLVSRILTHHFDLPASSPFPPLTLTSSGHTSPSMVSRLEFPPHLLLHLLTTVTGLLSPLTLRMPPSRSLFAPHGSAPPPLIPLAPFHPSCLPLRTLMDLAFGPCSLTVTSSSLEFAVSCANGSRSPLLLNLPLHNQHPPPFS
jgi:hypothetical protein